MKYTINDRPGVTRRWFWTLFMCAGMLTATGQQSELAVSINGHRPGCTCIECQDTRRLALQKLLEEERRLPKGRYVRKGAFATYEPTGVRERNDAALRQMGVISWSYLVKDTAFTPRVIAEFKFADGRRFTYNQKYKIPKEPADIVAEWLLEQRTAPPVVTPVNASPVATPAKRKAIVPSNYRTKRAFVEDYVRFRMTTATEDEKRQYRSRIEGADKAFRKALVIEAERMWASGR